MSFLRRLRGLLGAVSDSGGFDRSDEGGSYPGGITTSALNAEFVAEHVARNASVETGSPEEREREDFGTEL